MLSKLDKIINSNKPRNAVCTSENKNINIISNYIKKEVQNNECILYEIDGSKTLSEKSFFKEFSNKMPLIKGFGHNMAAFMDLLRTCGYGSNSDFNHYILWDNAHLLYKNNPDFFYEVIDIMFGISKELVDCEKEKDKFPLEFVDWEPTLLRCFIVADLSILKDNYDFTKLHDEFWNRIFYDRESNSELLML
ncbi:barstar family protein [Marininema halotolerans]|uniref:Barstar (Barnase inhibitor) n=1 Tax=Marininema halotolerans TaxID=1155944 RepID=A0A1I6ULJ4_9BACL|nr:barstar family protein [Marininema halotolerans]SFT02278.1 Barstar (barnase inhibitor) [Marininema halotolerans]